MIHNTMENMVGLRPVKQNYQNSRKRSKFNRAVGKTAKAVKKGYAISLLDGPVPVMDTIGFGIAVYETGVAWYEFFS